MFSSALVGDKKASESAQKCITSGSSDCNVNQHCHHYIIGPTGPSGGPVGPTGPEGPVGQVAMLELTNNYPLELIAQKNQLLLWNTINQAKSIGYSIKHSPYRVIRRKMKHPRHITKSLKLLLSRNNDFKTLVSSR